MMAHNQNHCTPLVSVIILNYKRLDELRKCLHSASGQDYPNREIIVVDNHSDQDLSSVVAPYGETVMLITLPANLGACGGRNAGIKAAHGEILVFLDNDVSFASPYELTMIVQAFAEYPQFHVLALQMCEPASGALRLREWCHARYWKDFGQTQFETHYFIEGACAFRRHLFDACGMYYERLFIGNEGHDLALRILDKGFRILYVPHIKVFHSMSAVTRSHERPYYFYTRNYIWITRKDYRLFCGLRFLIPKLAMMLVFSIRERHLRAFFRGLKDGLKGLAQLRGERTPISRQTVRYLDRIESFRPSWLKRLGRHWAETQL